MEALDFILVCIFNGSHFLMPSDSAKWCGIFGWWSLYLGRTTLTIQCLGSHPPNNQPDDHGRWLHEVNSGCGDFEHSGKLLCPEGREFLSAKVSPEFHRLATKPRMVTWLLGRFMWRYLRVRYGGMLCKMAWYFRNNEVMERIFKHQSRCVWVGESANNIQTSRCVVFLRDVRLPSIFVQMLVLLFLVSQ